MIQFSDYRKAYGAHEILKIGDLKIDRGLYWLQGANGSGKSTLLKSIAGILWFDGDISVDNVNAKTRPVDFRRLVNFCPAEPLFPASLTGRDLIALFAKAKTANDEQSRFLVNSMNVESFLDQPTASYSSGMKKKIALILAFLGDPTVILLDEPLITIDPDSLSIVYSWIMQRYNQFGTMFILSSHQSLNEESIPGCRKILIENKLLSL